MRLIDTIHFILLLAMLMPSVSGIAQSSVESTNAGPTQIEQRDIYFENATIDFPKLSIEEILCRIPEIPVLNLDEVASAVSVKCFNDKPFENADNVKKLYLEAKICECLMESKNESVKALMNPSKFYQQVKKASRSEDQMNRAKDRLDRKYKEINARHDDLTLQAAQIVSNDNELPILNLFRSRGMALGAGLFTSFIGRANISAEQNGKAAANDNHTNVAAQLQGKVETNQDQRNANFSKNYIEEKYEPNQCVSLQEYLSIQRVPQGLSFLKEFENGFVQQNWDFETLRQDFKKMVLIPNKSTEDKNKIQMLRTKILFLNHNPMVRHFFAATKSNSSNSDFDLLKQQQNLFESMKGAIAADIQTCSSRKNGKEYCLKTRMSGPGGFTEKVNGFFKNKDVALATKEAADASYAKEITDFVQSGQVFQEDDEVPSTHDELISKYLQIVNDYNPNLCNKNNNEMKLDKCVETYAGLCASLKPVLLKYPNRNDGFRDDLDFALENSLDPSFAKNIDLQKYNESVCGSKRRPKDRTLGKALSFNEYRETQCKNNSAGICDPKNMRDLRRAYYRLYTEPVDKGSVPVSQEAIAAIVNNDPPRIEKTVAKAALKPSMSYDEARQSMQEANLSAPVPGTGNNSRTLASASETSVNNSEDNSGVAHSASKTNSTFSDTLASNLPQSAGLGGSVGQLPLPTSAQNLSNSEKERIRDVAEDEIARARREIASISDSTEKTKLEERTKLLEQLLAQKTETEAKYQQLLTQLNQRVEKSTAQVNAKNGSDNADSKRTAQASTLSNLNSNFDDLNDRVNRAPANVNEARYANGGTGGTGGAGAVSGTAKAFQAASAKGSSVTSLGGANGALLDAAIAKGRSSSDGASIIVQEVDKQTVTAVESASVSGPQFSLNVPASVFTQFQSEDVEVLSRYKDQIIKNVEVNQTLRLTVKNGDKSMKIIVVNRNGNLVYIPSRVFSLRSLNQELQPARRPASQSP